MFLAMDAQDAWSLAVMEAQFPLSGSVPLFLPPNLYRRVKDDPRFARVKMAETRMLPIR